MSELSNIKSTLLAEQVQEQLYQYILDNHYEIGTKIPNEFELARYFGVGRSTIREAVKLLISMAHTVTSGSYKVENDPEMEFPIVYERVV